MKSSQTADDKRKRTKCEERARSPEIGTSRRGYSFEVMKVLKAAAVSNRFLSIDHHFMSEIVRVQRSTISKLIADSTKLCLLWISAARNLIAPAEAN